MCPYWAHMCILGWRTMLQAEVFHFVAPKNHFLFSECLKRGVLWSNHQTEVSKWYHPIFQKYKTTLHGQFPNRGILNLSAHSSWKIQIPPNQQEVGQIWTTGTWSNTHYFLEKSYLCSKYAISSEIHYKCSEIQPRAKNLHLAGLTIVCNGMIRISNTKVPPHSLLEKSF